MDLHKFLIDAALTEFSYIYYDYTSAYSTAEILGPTVVNYSGSAVLTK